MTDWEKSGQENDGFYKNCTLEIYDKQMMKVWYSTGNMKHWNQRLNFFLNCHPTSHIHWNCLKMKVCCLVSSASFLVD